MPHFTLRPLALSVIILSAATSACSETPDATEASEQIAVAVQPILSGFDQSPLWPLCGRVAGAYNQTPVWTDNDPCPSSRQGTSYTDFPLAATYGPRSHAASNPVYDWHRGIDIQAVKGTPIFLTSDGIVHSTSGSGDDQKLVMKHCRPGRETTCYGSTYPTYGSTVSNMSCSNDSCYYTVYDHTSSILHTTANKFLSKGTHVAKTGISDEGFPHLHFEVRNTRNFTADAVHPLSALPYNALSASNISVSNTTATENTDSTFTVGADVAFSTPNNTPQKLDLKEVTVSAKVFSGYTCTGGTAVVQYNTISQDNPLQNGYLSNPATLNPVVFNEMFTHRRSDSSSTPSRVSTSGTDYTNCPFATADHEFAADWDDRYADWHLIEQDLTDTTGKTGLFNGIQVLPLAHVNTSATVYSLRVAFQHVKTGGEDGSGAQVCFTVKATDLAGQNQAQTLCLGSLPTPPSCP